MNRATLIKQRGTAKLKATYTEELESKIEDITSILNQRRSVSEATFPDRKVIGKIEKVIGWF